MQLPDYTLRGITYLVTVTNAEHVTAEGGGGYDRATMYDSPGDDLLELAGESAKLSSWGTDDYSLEVIDFDWVKVLGTAGGEGLERVLAAAGRVADVIHHAHPALAE